MSTIRDFLVDKRIVQRHLEKNLVESTEYKKYLENLADMTSNAEYTRVGEDEEETAKASDEAAVDETNEDGAAEADAHEADGEEEAD